MHAAPDQDPAAPFPETADIETSSDDYASRFAGPVGEWMLAVQERLALALIDPSPAKAVLDVGGGHGQLAGPLCRRGQTVTVLGSAEPCARRIRALSAGGRCTFRVGNVIALPFPDRSFDTVISFRLLTHCSQWPKLIEELCRVARHSVVADYPTEQGLNKIAPLLFQAKKRLEGNTRTWRLFRHADVRREFVRCGFSPGRRRAQFFLPMVLHRTMKCRTLSVALEALCRAAGLTRLWGSPVIIEMVRNPVGGGAA